MTHQHHISRKELKKDEIRDTIVHGAEAALSHQRMLWMVIGGALLLVLAIVGWRFYSERQTVKASAAFEEAQKVFQARIRAVGEREEPGETTYVDEKNKYEDAAKKFAGVAQDYSRTRPGRLARYYAGICYEHLIRFDEAQKWFGEVENSGDAELAALARFRRAQVAEKAGNGDDAVKLYQQLIASPTTMMPKPYVMLALADYYRQANPQEAEKLYKQISTEFPDTATARAAQERLESLPPKS